MHLTICGAVCLFISVCLYLSVYVCVSLPVCLILWCIVCLTRFALPTLIASIFLPMDSTGNYRRIQICITKINLLLTEREGRTGEYWPEVVAVRTERSEVRTKTTEGQYSPVRLEQARLVSSLLYGTRVTLVSKLPAFENKKYTSYDHFHGNGPYGKIPTKKEPIRTPGFTLDYLAI